MTAPQFPETPPHLWKKSERFLAHFIISIHVPSLLNILRKSIKHGRFEPPNSSMGHCWFVILPNSRLMLIVVGCGLISSWFVQDLTRSRSGATTKHIVQAVGSSSKEKGSAFIEKHAPSSKPSIYSSYAEVYEDPSVEIVYIGTPHSCHLQNALDAINAGKNVLCEKPMTINAKETEILVKAAKEKGVFLMEGRLIAGLVGVQAENTISCLDAVLPNYQFTSETHPCRWGYRKYQPSLRRLRPRHAHLVALAFLQNCRSLTWSWCAPRHWNLYTDLGVNHPRPAS